MTKVPSRTVYSKRKILNKKINFLVKCSEVCNINKKKSKEKFVET